MKWRVSEQTHKNKSLDGKQLQPKMLLKPDTRHALYTYWATSMLFFLAFVKTKTFREIEKFPKIESQRSQCDVGFERYMHGDHGFKFLRGENVSRSKTRVFAQGDFVLNLGQSRQSVHTVSFVHL